MLAYGYDWNSRKGTPQVLREASLVCSRKELDALIEMLQAFRDEGPSEQEGSHQHFRDWSEGWSGKHSDFIIFIADQPLTKENQE